MIYNFMQYLKTTKPTYNYSVNGVQDTTPYNCVIVNETTATSANNIDRCDYTVQILSREKSPLMAEKQAQDIFSIVDRYYDIILPAYIVTLPTGLTETKPAIKSYQIIPIQRPTWFGYDANGLAMYVFNLKITTE